MPADVPLRYACLYTDIVGDLFHYGHVRLLQRAHVLCDRLVVGVCNDADVATYKRMPVMSMAERIEVVAACRHVDQVVPDAPLRPTLATLDAVGAEKLVRGDDMSPEVLDDFYRPLREQGKLILIPYTAEIGTSAIIRRIAQRLSEGSLEAQ